MADYVGQPPEGARQMGNYRLMCLLGRGGFAEVYLGVHVRLGTQAAVKVLHTRLASHDGVQEFEKEARTVAHLKHPHIVRVLDYDVQGDTPFLVMDYATGGTLRHRHPRGTRLPISAIIPYVTQVADALQYAHEQHIIHRDVKPENMLIVQPNDLLLSDFGISIIAQSSRYQSTQQVNGTMAYMAPEQIQGHPHPQSDQYSLGIVVYEWLSGSTPFHGSMTEIIAQHLAAPLPRLLGRVPGMAAEVEQVVYTALEKDPRKRFSSVKAFAMALQQASQNTYAALSPPSFPFLPSASMTVSGEGTLQRERMVIRAPLPQQPPSQTSLPPHSAAFFLTETVSEASRRPLSTLAPGISRSRSLIGSPRRALIAGVSIVVTSVLLLIALFSNGILSPELAHTPIPTAALVHTPTPTATPVPAGNITEFPLPIAKSEPGGITTGPDGNLWFTENIGNKIGRISPNGTITEFPLPTVQSHPVSITAGPDSNLWFTEGIGNKIGRISPNGTITEFPLPTNPQRLPDDIIVGPDGNLWFTESIISGIGRISPNGTITEFPVPTAQSNPGGITAGPDGNLWFTEAGGDKIGRISPNGTITEFFLPTAQSGSLAITAGPDGNLWFTENGGNKIGRISPSGTITEFPLLTAQSGPSLITAGPDGNLWFTENGGNKIGRITSGR